MGSSPGAGSTRVPGRVLAANGTRGGIIAVLAAIVAAVIIISPTARVWVVILAVIVLLLWIMGSVKHRQWKRRSLPAPAFTRRVSSGGMRTMLRRDHNAAFQADRWRFLWMRDERYWFIGTGCAPVALTAASHRGLASRQSNLPVLVAVDRDRRYWWWQDAFYWENEGYEPDDIMALVLQRQRDKERALQHAHDLMRASANSTSHRREPIPRDVQHFVFQRDGGVCQECGTNEDLQFDHIIPVAMGGGNGPDNLQLLCGPCNRSKGGQL